MPPRAFHLSRCIQNTAHQQHMHLAKQIQVQFEHSIHTLCMLVKIHSEFRVLFPTCCIFHRWHMFWVEFNSDAHTSWYSLVSTVFRLYYQFHVSEYSIVSLFGAVPHAYTCYTLPLGENIRFCSLIFEDKAHCCSVSCVCYVHLGLAFTRNCLVCACICTDKISFE